MYLVHENFSLGTKTLSTKFFFISIAVEHEHYNHGLPKYLLKYLWHNRNISGIFIYLQIFTKIWLKKNGKSIHVECFIKNMEKSDPAGIFDKIRL